VVSKALITAAGYGTRLLPATKNVPKELLPIIDTPTIKFIVDNCLEAGIKDIIIVTRFGNHAIEDFFDAAPALEKYLTENGKIEEAEKLKKMYSSANYIFIRQDPTLPYGSASPLYSARRLLQSEPFVYCWGDDIVIGKGVGVCESIDLFNKSDVDVTLFTTHVIKDMVTKLGMVVFEKESNFVKSIVEKPSIDQVISQCCHVSNFVSTPEIFAYLNPKKIDTKEFIFQPAINQLCQKGRVNAVRTKGKWMTMGDPLNYVKTIIDMALYREDLRGDIVEYIKSLNL